MNKRLPIFIIILLARVSCVFSQEETFTDSVLIHFRQSKVNLDTNYMDNPQSLREVRDKIAAYASPDSALQLKQVRVVGGASPEGSVKFNKWLSQERANRIFDYLSESMNIPDSITSFTFLGRDWSGLRRLVMQDSAVPYRADVLQLLDKIIMRTSEGGETEAMHNVQSLKNLHKGLPYQYLYKHHFPKLRASRLAVDFARPVKPVATETFVMLPADTLVVHDTVYVEKIVYWCPPCKPFYMGLKTNMLLDALLIPNIGAEFYLGKNLSIAGQWMYGWWDKNSTHFWWRMYGGEVDFRWWFGKKAHAKPLTGHHLGLYAGVVTYDFELGHTGYMGGLPGKTLWDRCNYQGGIEYGYSLPVAKRLNIDFTIGIGYFGGKYIVYEPEGKWYAWKETRMRNWFGPTKAEISLVWLIGCDNYNVLKAKKGGKSL